MESFVRAENIKRFRKLYDSTADPAERRRILKLLAEEEARDVRRPAETPSGVGQPEHNGALATNNKHTRTDYGIALILMVAWAALCGIVIGVEW